MEKSDKTFQIGLAQDTRLQKTSGEFLSLEFLTLQHFHKKRNGPFVFLILRSQIFTRIVLLTENMAAHHHKAGPGLLFISKNGGSERVDDLVGRKFFSITAGESDVIAVCNDGVHGVNNEGVKQISISDITVVSSGKNFFAACDANKGLYTWGYNCTSGQVKPHCPQNTTFLSHVTINFAVLVYFVFEQLGHGACHPSLAEPTKVTHSARFVSVSSGDAFTLALDDAGSAYSWGEVGLILR